MPIAITPLLELDETAEFMATSDVVDLVRLNVPAVATSEEQAVEVLIRLGRDEAEAWRHVRYCATGNWGLVSEE